MTGTGAYLISVGELALVGGAVLLGAVRLRRALLPAWSGGPALVVDTVLALAQVIVVSELLGVLHLFKEGWFVVACVVMGLSTMWIATRLAPAENNEALEAPTVGRTELLAAAAVALLLVIRWAIGTEESLHGGMYGFDTMWYHGPFAAGFAQDASVTAIHFTGAYGPLAWFFPQNSELLHGGGILLFGNDFLSPLINLGWLAFALLAAWCIGRPGGAGALTVVGAAIVLGSLPWLESQPGEGYNDIAAIALLLAAIAILVNGRALRRGDTRVLVVAGIAAGLAIGTKLTVLPALAAMTVGLIALAPAGARRATAVAWLGPLVAIGSFWFLRNLFLVGNPLPSVDLGIFPAPLLPPQRSNFAVAHYLTDADVWRDFFFPGLRDAMGIAWPLVLAGGAAGAVLALWRANSPLIRVLGAAAIFAAVAYVFTPYGAQGPEGQPRNFEGNFRYAAPALLVGLALLVTLPALASERRRLSVLGVLAVVFVVVVEPFDARHGPYLKAGIAIAALIVLVPIGAQALARRGTPRLLVALGLAAIAAMTLVAGHRQERLYIDSRYASPLGSEQNRALDQAFHWARGVRNARIGTDAFRQYGLYGNRLSNRVEFVGREGAHGSFLSVASCAEWRRKLNEGDYDYVVPAPTYRDAAGNVRAAPPFNWTRTDPAARPVPDAGPVFEVVGRFDPSGC